MEEIELIKQLCFANARQGGLVHYGLDNLSEHNNFDPADIFSSRINILREKFNVSHDLDEVLLLCDELKKLHRNFYAYIRRS